MSALTSRLPRLHRAGPSASLDEYSDLIVEATIAVRRKACQILRDGCEKVDCLCDRIGVIGEQKQIEVLQSLLSQA